MRISRTVIAAGLLAVEAGLAALGVLVHYGLTAEYGDVTDSAPEGLRAGFSTGIGAIALVLIGLPALVAMSVGPRLWVRLTALAIPVLMTLWMLAVTPAALREKLEVQYDATPQCVVADDAHHLRAERDGMAFEVVSCGGGGVVWAGRLGHGGGARCDQQ